MSQRLPSFKGLVDAVYEKLKRRRELNPLEQNAYDQGSYDQVFANLERSHGKPQVAFVFWRSLDAAGDRSATLWRDRIGPWLDACWQADEALKDRETSGSLIRMALPQGTRPRR